MEKLMVYAQRIMLPRPYSNTKYTIVATAKNNDNARNIVVNTNDITNNNFLVQAYSTNDTTCEVNFICIGQPQR